MKWLLCWSTDYMNSILLIEMIRKQISQCLALVEVIIGPDCDQFMEHAFLVVTNGQTK